MFRHIQCITSINAFIKIYILKPLTMLNVKRKVHRCRLNNFEVQGREYMRRQVFQERCNENHRYILGKCLVVHSSLTFLSEFLNWML